MTDQDLKIYREAIALLDAAPDTEGCVPGVTILGCYYNAMDTAKEEGRVDGVEYEDAIAEHFVTAVKLYEII